MMELLGICKWQQYNDVNLICKYNKRIMTDKIIKHRPRMIAKDQQRFY